MKFRLYQALIAFDQLLNAVLFGGWADETMSSAAWRLEQEGRIGGRIARPVIDKLLWFDRDHCRVSYESERDRAQLPPGLREVPASNQIHFHSFSRAKGRTHD